MQFLRVYSGFRCPKTVICLVPKCGTGYLTAMQILSKRALRQFWETHPQAEAPLRTWYALVDKAEWSTPNDVKAQFGANVDFVGDNRIIFAIGGM